MSQTLKTTNKSQKGFTLNELLIALAITGVIGGTITMSIIQLVSVNAQNTSRITALKQVENATYWISRDAQMAQTVQTVGGSGFPLTLTWVDFDNTSNNVTYSLQSGELRRAYSVNGGQPTVTVVAKQISNNSTATNFQFDGDVLTFKITASPGGFRPVSESRVTQVVPKPR